MIDLNTATLQDLLKTPGISRSQAEALYAHRPFLSWADVEETPGMTADVVKWLQAVGLRLGDPVLREPAAAAARPFRASEEPTEG